MQERMPSHNRIAQMREEPVVTGARQVGWEEARPWDGGAGKSDWGLASGMGRSASVGWRHGKEVWPWDGGAGKKRSAVHG